MSEVYKLGVSIKNNQPINEVNSIDVITNQGVVGDRHFTVSYTHLTLPTKA